MSTAKENSCRKFQANFFNKSKCQNCFKPRELHLLTDQDLTQAKPIYGGWLCLAPEGTDFDNPMQRSRKWQRRFFVLYEHGCLRFALDESPSTLPQGTVNMNLCTDVIDAEPKTGQKNSLCIITPDQEYFIRGENREIINGWSEQLVVYPRTNKQNQKKKRKVEPTTFQEPGPAKVPVTGSGIPEAEKVPDSSSIIWQEELNQREAEGAAVWAPAELLPGSPLPPTGANAPQGSDTSSVNGEEVTWGGVAVHDSAPPPSSDPLSPTGSCSSLGGVPRCLSPAPSDPFPSGSSLLSNGSHISGSVSSLDSDASGSTVTSTDSHPANQRGGHGYSHHDGPRARRLEAEARKAEKRSRFSSPERREREIIVSPEGSRSGVIEKLEALELENPEKMEVEESGRSGSRQGRSEHRRFPREEQRHNVGQGLDFPSTRPPLRRAKSLDRRTTESVMTLDLLNFKKGWMVLLDEQGQWKKYWFVLTAHSLRYYKDSIAEEASDLDGEIDLTTCYSVTEYQAQRNYGFQIHTQEGIHTLSAMTAGIRRNWIQAVMKNIRPSTAPDVASSTDHGSLLESLVRPDVAQDSPFSETPPVERDSAPAVTKSRARERRREGRSKTFDWAEFRPIAQALAQLRAQESEGVPADVGEPELGRRREERWKSYESVTGSSTEQTSDRDGGRTDLESGETDSGGATSSERQQRVEEVIEQHWQQVEKTPIRGERRVPLPSTVQSTQSVELEQLLESYKQGMEDLKAQMEICHQQLLDSNKHKQELEVQLRTALEREQDVRTGYISPLEHPLVLEADVTPQTKRPELVSSQAQSLTKKYQETKELLKLQEMKKRSMQAQLGLSLSHPPTKEPYFPEPQNPPEVVQKTVSFLLQDSSEAVQELEDLIAGKHVSLKELAKLLRLHSQETADKSQLEKLLETWKYQLEVENETLKKSLARAGESMCEYEARLLTMEDLLVKFQKQEKLSEMDNRSETTNDVLAQRVEYLTCENGALKQRCQEIVNQLTEADREIDRLKMELVGQQGGQQHHLVMEELKRTKAELAENQANAIDRDYYERELNDKSLRLHEALIMLEEVGNTLKDTEKKLLRQEAKLEALGFHDEDGTPDRDLLKASEVSLLAVEGDLEGRDSELITLNHESEMRTQQEVEKTDDEELVKQVVENLEMKSEAIDQVLGMLTKVDVNVEKMLSGVKNTLFGGWKEEPLCVSEKDMRSVIEVEFWIQLLASNEIPDTCKRAVAQKTLMSKGRIRPQESGDVTELSTMYRWLDDETYALILKEVTDTLQEKSCVLKQIASDVKSAKDDQLVSLALTSFDQKPQHLTEALNEAYTSYMVTRLKVQHDRAFKQVGSSDIPDGRLSEITTGSQNEPEDSSDQYAELHNVIARQRRELEEVTETYKQETERLRQETVKASEMLRVHSEESAKEIETLTNCVENLKKKHETERKTLTEMFVNEMEELSAMMRPSNTRTDADGQTHHVQTSSLKEQIQELLHRVSVMSQEQGDISALRLKYEKDLDTLKATCERGFAAMEESHQKVIDELQRKHQRELENLHEEKERLLAEETAATISAIEAMKNAHRTELEKELDKARKANSNTENADIEEIRRQHEEELCSFHREIEVLSEQYSQKCLENAHLAQALEAERQALRQCQRENQELNAHNQELNNRLAAEITKMRSMTSEDGAGDGSIQGKELYEFEVMLRVKESEVQYLKQEINSLKDELQAAQRDKKYATDKYKDIYTELSIVKAKAERDLSRLRDQLQLAHESLGESLEDVERGGYDIMKSKSNPDILKMAAAAAKRSERTMRSKSLKEGLTAEQRLHLFDNKDSKEF